MKTATITIYIARWDNRDFVFSLDKDKAISLVKTHFAYGDPSEDEYAVGNRWATGKEDIGWRIAELRVTVPMIEVNINKSESEGTSHVIWQCPYCSRYFSEDWHISDELPVLLGCSCVDAAKFLLGT